VSVWNTSLLSGRKTSAFPWNSLVCAMKAPGSDRKRRPRAGRDSPYRLDTCKPMPSRATRAHRLQLRIVASLRPELGEPVFDHFFSGKPHNSCARLSALT
jgi:hypothetical protein